MNEFRALLKYIKPFRWILVLSTLCMLLVTVSNMAGPWLIRNLIGIITAGENLAENLSRVSLLALGVIVVYFLRALSQFGTDYLSHVAAWNILNKKIRYHLYEHIQSLSLSYFEDKQTGELMSRVVDDTRNFEQLLAHAIPTIVVNGLMLVGISSILFTMNAKLALYTIIPMPVLAWLVIYFSKVSRPLFKNSQQKVAEINSILQDNFSGIKEIKSFTQERYESGRTMERLAAHTKAVLRALMVSNAFHPLIQFVSSTGTVIVIFFGGRMALRGELPIEDIVAFLLYLGMFYQPITALGGIMEGLQQALASAERVLEILAQKPESYEEPGKIKLERAEGRIEFQNVSFRYEEDIPVLKNISFTVKPGESVALVGPTGVGKTTIANLIPRFYEPNSGKILIDGYDLSDVDLYSLRKQISIVSQDVFLFNGTVRENILYGRPDATDDEIIEAAKAANAHNFILELSDGYETEVGERGVKLSGGQKQRISIARAILKDSPILILDEATSSVDTHTERLIQEALNTLMKDKTTIIIAHRLSTIRECDQILVLDDGEIVERGTHDELIKLGGLYSRLCKEQSTYENLAM